MSKNEQLSKALEALRKMPTSQSPGWLQALKLSDVVMPMPDAAICQILKMICEEPDETT